MKFLTPLVATLAFTAAAATAAAAPTFGFVSGGSSLPIESGKYQLAASVGELKTVDLVVRNSGGESITSVRAKLKYDPNELEVTTLDTSGSAFPLAAPGEDNIFVDRGTVLIGRSFLGESRNDTQMLVGKLTFKVKKAGALLSFLNFQKSALGDTAIYKTEGVSNINLVTAYPAPLKIGARAAVTTIPVDNTPVTPKAPPPLPRPNPIKIQTLESGLTSVIWALSSDTRVRGYYLYYGTRSGTYIRRKDLGLVNIAQISNLPKDSRYYFAVTAYSNANAESDYSDEVTAIIGQPGSESHRFIGDPRQAAGVNSAAGAYNGVPTSPQQLTNQQLYSNINQVGRTTSSGPEDALPILAFVAGAGCLFVAVRRLRRQPQPLLKK